MQRVVGYRFTFVVVAPLTPLVGLVQACLKQPAAEPPSTLHGGFAGFSCIWVTLFPFEPI